MLTHFLSCKQKNLPLPREAHLSHSKHFILDYPFVFNCHLSENLIRAYRFDDVNLSSLLCNVNKCQFRGFNARNRLYLRPFYALIFNLLASSFCAYCTILKMHINRNSKYTIFIKPRYYWFLLEVKFIPSVFMRL